MFKTIALLATLVTGPVFAADMPLKARLAPTTVPTWTGMYAGFHGGQNLGSFSPFCDPDVCGPTSTEINLDDNSWFVGGHIGYLVQTASGIVFGPEVGVQYWGLKSRADKTVVISDEEAAIVGVATFQQKVDWLAYANARIGLTPLQGVLVYATGGVAWAHVKGELINLNNIDASFTQSVMGWNVGGGVEFQISPTITFGGEYRHYDFGKVSAANPVLNLMGLSSDNLTVDQALARLSFKLN